MTDSNPASAVANTPAGRPAFGVDAPLVPTFLGGAAIVFLVIFAISPTNVWALIVGLIMAVQAASYLYATLRGKHVVWRHLLDDLHLRGDEQLLDMGCGRGAVLLAAAARLPNGRAVGADLWRSVDQSGNAEQVTRRNAELTGASNRVELHTADMTHLPFPDGSFDVVTSSLAIHNIPSADGRDAAIGEAWRMLRPGGRLRVADIRHAKQYAAQLQQLGATDVTVRGLGPRFWFSGPWQATTLVTASRPD